MDLSGEKRRLEVHYIFALLIGKGIRSLRVPDSRIICLVAEIKMDRLPWYRFTAIPHDRA